VARESEITMAGTKTGGALAAETNKAKYGSDYYARMGKLGGMVKGKKGFAVSGKAVEAGRIGGQRSKRTKRVVQEA
jgi:uncharacterized protein